MQHCQNLLQLASLSDAKIKCLFGRSDAHTYTHMVGNTQFPTQVMLALSTSHCVLSTECACTQARTHLCTESVLLKILLSD